MSEKTSVVRGFRDVYPGDSERFDLVERSMIEVIGTRPLRYDRKGPHRACGR